MLFQYRHRIAKSALFLHYPVKSFSFFFFPKHFQFLFNWTYPKIQAIFHPFLSYKSRNVCIYPIWFPKFASFLLFYALFLVIPMTKLMPVQELHLRVASKQRSGLYHEFKNSCVTKCIDNYVIFVLSVLGMQYQILLNLKLLNFRLRL